MKVCAALALFLILSSIRAAESPAEPPKDIMSVTLPDKINWRRSASADTAILQGDPSKPGLYIELVRWHAGNMSRPHMHPTARYITVISGTWWLGSGTKFDPASTYPGKAGTYVVHHPNEMHYDGAKDEDCVIQIVGMGPE